LGALELRDGFLEHVGLEKSLPVLKRMALSVGFRSDLIGEFLDLGLRTLAFEGKVVGFDGLVVLVSLIAGQPSFEFFELLAALQFLNLKDLALQGGVAVAELVGPGIRS